MADYLNDIRGGSSLPQALSENPSGIVIDGESAQSYVPQL